jgi:DDE superfamily endonuclease/Helix-turn-helix of DDE superfamily endonuclease
MQIESKGDLPGEGARSMSKVFSAVRLRASACFQRLTGVSVTTFDQMLIQLSPPWNKFQARKRKSGRPWETGGLEDHLLIMLIYYRCYVTQEFIGFFYNVDKSAICRAIQRIEKLAKPLFGVKREPRVTRTEAEALIIDCTEQPIHRPGDDVVQKRHYSGKKKRHTLKNEYIVTKKGRIASVSPSQPGSRHDLTIRRAGGKLPEGARAYADSAYQGYDNEHKAIDFPYKKPKGGKLTDEEKEYNTGLSRFRVRVEHKIGQVKRFRIVSDPFRNPRRTHFTKTSIIAGIVNMASGFQAC